MVIVCHVYIVILHGLYDDVCMYVQVFTNKLSVLFCLRLGLFKTNVLLIV